MSALFLLSGKFVGLLSPFILKGIVNSMAAQSFVGVAGSAGSVTTGFTSMRFWKAGLALLFWGATRALSSILVQNHMLNITKAIQ